MAYLRARGSLTGLFAVVALTYLAAPAAACPFCEEKGPTLLGDYKQAALVMVGTFTNPKLDPNSAYGEGTTDFRIETVLKRHEILGDKKVITLPRYVPKNDKQFLLFCDVYKGSIDAYRGVEVQSGGDMVKYLQGALDPKHEKTPARLRYCFDFLNNPEFEIAIDAYREFAKADYKDYQDMAKSLPADKIAGWLKDPKTPPFRYGLYSSLLGHCGKDEHAKLLRQMLDDPQKRSGSGLDGMLAAYVMLKPREGWDYLNGILKDEKEDFLMRYAGLRTVRFFWDTRADVLDKKELLKGACQLLEQTDIADFVIEDLRKWKQWDVTDRVLGLLRKESHQLQPIRRAVLRYALCNPQQAAAAFVEQLRRDDREFVTDTEELLKLETEEPPAKSTTPAKTK